MVSVVNDLQTDPISHMHYTVTFISRMLCAHDDVRNISTTRTPAPPNGGESCTMLLWAFSTLRLSQTEDARLRTRTGIILRVNLSSRKKAHHIHTRDGQQPSTDFEYVPVNLRYRIIHIYVLTDWLVKKRFQPESQSPRQLNVERQPLRKPTQTPTSGNLKCFC